MKTILLITFLGLFSLNSYSEKTVGCLIKTSIGNIRIVLNPEKAPVTVCNFLKYVDGKLFDGSTFFRVSTPENEKERTIKIEVIQGGELSDSKQFAPIPIETTRQTGIKHQNGTISMARDTPDSATSSFFICINDQPELDFGGKRNPDGQGFAAFGRVTKGMKIVKRIQRLENKDQRLLRPVQIISVRRSTNTK